MIKQALVASLVCVGGLVAAAGVTQDAAIPSAARNYWAFRLPVQAPCRRRQTISPIPSIVSSTQTRRDKGLDGRAARVAAQRCCAAPISI